MNKTFATLCAMAAASMSADAAPIVYDGFAYTSGGNLKGNSNGAITWTGLNSGASVTVSSGNLTTPGLASPTGNKASMPGGNSEEALGAFTSQSSGTIFYSFSFELTSLPTSGYTFALSTGNTNYSSAIWFQTAGSGFNVGLSNRSNSAANYDSTTLSLNTTYFVVGSYTFNADTGNDTSALWINPLSSTFSSTAPAPTLVASGGTDMAAVSQFLIRGSVTGSPSGSLDELRIGTTWNDVTPVPEPGVVGLLIGGLGMTCFMVRRNRSLV